MIDEYRQTAIRAKRAGFDLVEVHAANAYLLQQFMATGSNKRTDDYGGSLENRARLTLAVVDAVCEVMGDSSTFYGGDEHGYTDYPVLEEETV